MITVPKTEEFMDRPPARVYWLPLLVCLTVTLGGAALVWSVRAQLPDPVTTHWGVNGKPDGFTPVDRVITVGVVLTLALNLPLLALGAALKQARALAPVVAGMSVFCAAASFGIVWVQKGHAAGPATFIWWPMLMGGVAAIVVGALTWLATRAPKILVPTTNVLPAQAPRLDSPPNGRLAWTGPLVRGRAVHWFFGLVSLPVVGMAVIFAVMGSMAGAVAMGLTLLAIIVPFQMMFTSIIIDSRGVRTAGPIRWLNIPLETILSAEVGRTVSPLGDFGGYGLRAALFDGARGLVTAEAATLLVQQAGRPPMYITVADPATAAATLNTLLIAQRRGR